MPRHRTIRFWLRLLSPIVPPAVRPDWRRRRESSLDGLCVLEHRGELAGQAPALLSWFCRDALSNAVLLRTRGADPRSWVRTPAFLIAATSFALLLIAAATHGFAVTRTLVDALHHHPAPIPVSDRLFGNLAPIAFALGAGTMTAIHRASLPAHGWRYLSFLVLKTISLLVVATALWIEGGAALRAAIPAEVPRAVIGGVALAIAFVAAFDWIILWSLADQQHRCPVCLRRLVFPVRIGTWASIFEPVTTEWICEAGHGTFCEHENANADCGRWVKLESSC